MNITTPEKTIKILAMRISWLHVVLLVVVFLWFRSCSEKKQLENQITQSIRAVNDTIKYYKNKEGEIVASKLALEGDKISLEMLLESSRDSTKQLKKLAKKYKNISAAARVETITKIDSIIIPYTVSGSDFNIPFNLNKEYYSISGNSTNKGLFINDFSIPNSQSIIIGDKKEGFFKTEYRIEAVNSNPHVKVTSIDGFNHTERKKRFGVGFHAGYGISVTGLTPQIGVSINYSIIRF